MKKLMLLLMIVCLTGCSSDEPIISVNDNYLNQSIPVESVEEFAHEIITKEFEAQNCLTISDTRGEIYYGVYNSVKKINEVYCVKFVDNVWTEPFIFNPFDIEASIDAPFISPDEKRLYFISRYGTNEDEQIERVWYVEWLHNKWSEPVVLPSFFDEYEIHMQFSVAADYSLYFKSKHDTGFGESDLYVSKYIDGVYQEPINLGQNINTPANEMSPYISPDQSYIIFSRNKTTEGYGGADLYMSVKDDLGDFGEAELMSYGINSASHETCPIVSPDEKYLFFNSTRLGRFEIYWTELNGYIE